MKKFTEKLTSLLVCFAITISGVLVPCSASAIADNEQLPAWVAEGEIWHPADGIMPLEDFGNCPKGHTGPAGFTYKGYSTGLSNVIDWDPLSKELTIAGIVTSIEQPELSAILFLAAFGLNELPDFQYGDPIHYWKYVYTKAGRAPYVHVIYAYEGSFNGKTEYYYLTCETYYEL